MFILSLITNVTVSSLTGESTVLSHIHTLANNTLAARIWWITRHGRAILSKEITKTYMTVIAIMCEFLEMISHFCNPFADPPSSLESGAIYSISVMILLAVFTQPGPQVRANPFASHNQRLIHNSVNLP